MRILFLEYPKCSTCKKAKAWLTENGVAFDDRHIVEDNPTAEELKAWWEKSGLDVYKRQEKSIATKIWLKWKWHIKQDVTQAELVP